MQLSPATPLSKARMSTGCSVYRTFLIFFRSPFFSQQCKLAAEGVIPPTPDLKEFF